MKDYDIDVKVYRAMDISKKIDFSMDYEDYTLRLANPMEKEEAIEIAIYADKRYINEVIINTDNILHNRILRQDEPDDVLKNKKEDGRA